MGMVCCRFPAVRVPSRLDAAMMEQSLNHVVRSAALKCLAWALALCSRATAAVSGWRQSVATNLPGTCSGALGAERTREALEHKLAKERELLRTLLENVPDCIYFKDRESRFVHVSRSKVLKVFMSAPSFRERLRKDKTASDGPSIDPQALVGLTDFDTFTEEHARPAFEDEQEIIRTGKPIIGKLEKETHLDGTVTWCLSTKMPWRDKDGNIMGTFGISRDITPLKRAEADLEAAHKRLVETSRLAGMAEVATDVLHNVGNTLNSINVSCSVVIDRVKHHNFNNVARIPALLTQHAGRLDEFLTSDPQGKRIPEYLAAVAQNGEDEKAFLLQELGQLRKHIDHVNQIVSMQQSYAKVAGIEEVVDIGQLVEDAFQINAAALGRHEIQVHRRIDPTPHILVDKHKVLQILVNLIRNAKYALSESQQKDKTLTLRVTRSSESRVAIQVIDNGVGMSPENLTRIFSHGFTTRRDGHGFGLHSGALAARDLGGALTAQSDGPGKGAVFTLALPLKASEKAK